MSTEKNHSIDQLIRDLVVEDQFKAKYTSRQRSVFCKNMYAKVSNFVKEENKEHLKHVEESQTQLHDYQNRLKDSQRQLVESHHKMEEVQNLLDQSRSEIEDLEAVNKELDRGYKGIFIDTMWAIRLGIYATYIYVVWFRYKVKDDISMNDTNSTSEIPYNSA